jgi:hypothetical protein
MKNAILCILIVVPTLSFIPTSSCSGQAAPAIEAAAKELAGVMARQGGRKAATELAEMGGEAAVRQVLDRAAKEGGDELVEKVTRYGTRYGPTALKAVEKSPSRMIQALDEVAPDLVKPAIRAAAREPEITAKLVAAYGKDALEVAAKHTGIGTRLAEKLGADGISIAQKLSTDDAIALARYADDIAALPSGERSQLLAAMKEVPTAVLDYLEKHPKVLLTAGGVAVVIAAKDSLLGSPVPARAGDDPAPGFVERVFSKLIGKFNGPIAAVLDILIGGVACWVAIQLWSVWRLKCRRDKLRGRFTAAPGESPQEE